MLLKKLIIDLNSLFFYFIPYVLLRINVSIVRVSLTVCMCMTRLCVVIDISICVGINIFVRALRLVMSRHIFKDATY